MSCKVVDKNGGTRLVWIKKCRWKVGAKEIQETLENKGEGRPSLYVDRVGLVIGIREIEFHEPIRPDTQSVQSEGREKLEEHLENVLE